MNDQPLRWLFSSPLCVMLGLAGCTTESGPALTLRSTPSPESLPLFGSSGDDTATTSDPDPTGFGSTDVTSTSMGETGDTGDDFIDPWEPGELWLDEFVWLSEDEGGGSETGGSETGGSETGGGETGDTDTGAAPPTECAAGEFTIIVLVKLKYGVEGTVTFAHGTMTKTGEESAGGVVNREYLACIPADKILGPMAPGVRVTAAVTGTNAADRVVGMRRGIDRNWIGQCTGTPARSCHIDAKFNANGTNTLPIAVAVVVVEFARIETAPPPREVKQ